MKVALVSPAGAERNQQNDIIFDIYQDFEGQISLMMDDIEFIPNLALLTIASFLDPSWQVEFIEEDYIPPDKVDEILFGGSFDIAMISIVNYTALRGYEIADKYRNMGVYVVMGGLHASALPDEAILHSDTVIVGEGENLIVQFIEDFLRGNPQRVYRSTKYVDLTTIPPTRYDLIKNPGRYNKMPVFATRGCPRNCDFCCFPSLYGRKFRHKTVQQVIQDIDKIKQIHPSPYIHFCDENLLCNREFSIELLEALVRMEVPWECFCDIGIAEDDKILALLKKSRCKSLLIGLETIDPHVMAKVDPWKSAKLRKYKEDIRKIQSYRLPITGLFVLGFDGDDSGVFQRVVDFIADVGLHDMDFAILTPIPGSNLYSRLKAEGRIISENWSKYTWTHVNFQPMRMRAEELQEGLLWIFREFATGRMLAKRPNRNHYR